VRRKDEIPEFSQSKDAGPAAQVHDQYYIVHHIVFPASATDAMHGFLLMLLVPRWKMIHLVPTSLGDMLKHFGLSKTSKLEI